MSSLFKRLATLPLVLSLLLLSACSTVSPAPTTAPIPEGNQLDVYFLDVGQADSIFLRCEGETMLIDGGNVDDSSLVVSFLTQQGVDTLNHVICTHAHEDHVGGLSGALSQFTAERVYSPVTEYDTRAFENFVRYTEQQGLSLTVPSVGDSWTLGDAVVTVLGPQRAYQDTNDTSIVVRVDYGETSFLFTGDAETPSEDDMLDAGVPLEATVLKVGHHGSSSSTGYRFLRTVNPTYAVIQCGVDNDYGHPHDEVMSRLRDADLTVYRTDMQGTIHAVSDGKEVTFTTDTAIDVDTNPGETTAGVYIGNKNSKSFHTPDCASLPSEKNQVMLGSREEAIVEGYTPCGRCNP